MGVWVKSRAELVAPSEWWATRMCGIGKSGGTAIGDGVESNSIHIRVPPYGAEVRVASQVRLSVSKPLDEYTKTLSFDELRMTETRLR